MNRANHSRPAIHGPLEPTQGERRILEADATTTANIPFTAIMAITTSQKTEIESIIRAITDATVPRRKRKLADMFLDLPDADAYPEYYEVFSFSWSVMGGYLHDSRLFQRHALSTMSSLAWPRASTRIRFKLTKT